MIYKSNFRQNLEQLELSQVSNPNGFCSFICQIKEPNKLKSVVISEQGKKANIYK